LIKNIVAAFLNDAPATILPAPCDVEINRRSLA
jgi:hypothetical protein